MPPVATDESRIEARARLRRQLSVLAGLFLTLLGFLLAAGTLPTSAGPLDRALPLLGASLAAVWVGGILLGRGPARRPR